MPYTALAAFAAASVSADTKYISTLLHVLSNSISSAMPADNTPLSASLHLSPASPYFPNAADSTVSCDIPAAYIILPAADISQAIPAQAPSSRRKSPAACRIIQDNPLPSFRLPLFACLSQPRRCLLSRRLSCALLSRPACECSNLM